MVISCREKKIKWDKVSILNEALRKKKFEQRPEVVGLSPMDIWGKRESSIENLVARG